MFFLKISEDFLATALAHLSMFFTLCPLHCMVHLSVLYILFGWLTDPALFTLWLSHLPTSLCFFGWRRDHLSIFIFSLSALFKNK
jgi:hypothetical protein